MKLEQGQIWKQGDEYFRITQWARAEIVYKTITDPLSKNGELKKVTKKEFCRLIKGAELLVNGKPLPAPVEEVEP